MWVIECTLCYNLMWSSQLTQKIHKEVLLQMVGRIVNRIVFCEDELCSHCKNVQQSWLTFNLINHQVLLFPSLEGSKHATCLFLNILPQCLHFHGRWYKLVSFKLWYFSNREYYLYINSEQVTIMTYYSWFSIKNSNSNGFANEKYSYHNYILKWKIQYAF